ncbi:MAG: helix-turn-helix transcriptional regulator [Bacteroidales bacterium]|nr:helix-turn-helix transcriptional regulator [Bacteroidales bacterium]
MHERLLRFLAAENITQSQLADSLGVARASISHMISGRNKPGFDFIEKMARQYPGLNLDWLVTGRGKMYKSAPDSPSELPENSLFEEEITAAPEIERVIVFYKDGTFREIR